MTEGSGRRLVATEVWNLVRALPASLVEFLARSLEDTSLADWSATKARILGGFPNPHYRVLVAEFLHAWHDRAPNLSAEAVSLALLTARSSEEGYRKGQSIELVWTGPDVGVIPLRRTEQAILQVVDSASRRLTIVSYAVFRIRHIQDALARAASRGIGINVVMETPDQLENENTYSTLKALGKAVAERCRVYVWPLDRRERDGRGKPGILHVKCAVSDGKWLFLSSANLTEYAFTVNMELGLLVSGGELPGLVESQFDRLIQTGVLARV